MTYCSSCFQVEKTMLTTLNWSIGKLSLHQICDHLLSYDTKRLSGTGVARMCSTPSSFLSRGSFSFPLREISWDFRPSNSKGVPHVLHFTFASRIKILGIFCRVEKLIAWLQTGHLDWSVAGFSCKCRVIQLAQYACSHGPCTGDDKMSRQTGKLFLCLVLQTFQNGRLGVGKVATKKYCAISHAALSTLWLLQGDVILGRPLPKWSFRGPFFRFPFIRSLKSSHTVQPPCSPLCS